MTTLPRFPTATIQPQHRIGLYVNCFERGLWYYAKAIVEHFGMNPVYLSIKKGRRPTNIAEFPMKAITYDMSLSDWLQKTAINVLIAFEGSAHVGSIAQSVQYRINVVNWECVKAAQVGALQIWSELWLPTEKTAEKFAKWHPRIRIMRGVNWAPDITAKPKTRSGPIIIYHNCGMAGVHERKNTSGTIEAFKLAALKRNDLHLHITAQRHLGCLEAAKHPRIKIHYGTFTRDAIIDCYRDAHIAVQPSKREGFGVPMYEALAAGCAIVTTDAPPMNEIPHSAQTFFVPVSSTKPVVGSLIPLCITSNDAIASKILEAAAWADAARIQR